MAQNKLSNMKGQINSLPQVKNIMNSGSEWAAWQ